jgi:alpha-1,2-mannosyltransferase
LPNLFRLTRNRMMVWSSLLLLQELCVFAFMIAGTHGAIVGLARPVTTDYVSFYAAGELAHAGEAPLAYDRPAHYAAEQNATEPGVPYVYFFYPPIFLLLCAVFARLPYLLSFLAFEGLTFALYLATIWRVMGAQGWGWLIPVTAFPACFVTLGMGQNAFLTAALFAGGTMLLERRQILAGLLFGLLCYKPHFGLLLPLVLAACGYWRAIGAAAATVAALVGASVALFGAAAWSAYLTAFLSSRTVYESGAVRLHAFITPFGAARLMGAPPGAAYMLQAAVSLLVAALVVWLWRRGRHPATRNAALVAGTMLAVPLALYYDLVIETVAIAWLVRGRSPADMPGWEKLSLVAIYAVALLTAGIGHSFALPLGPLGAMLLLSICSARSLRARPMA